MEENKNLINYKVAGNKTEKMLFSMLFFCVGIGFIDFWQPIIKYSKYLLPMLSLCIFTFGVLYNKVRFIQREKVIFTAIMILVFPVIYNLLTFNIHSPYFIKHAILISLPVFCAYTLAKISIINRLNIIYILFLSLAAGYLIGCFVRPAFQSFLFFRETTLSPTFGFLTVYFFIKGNKSLCFFSLVFCILSYKRIAIAATILTIIYFFLFFRKERRPINLSFIILISAIFLYIYSIKAGYLGLLETKYRIITSGRTYIYSLLIEDISANPIFGQGLGYTEEKLIRMIPDYNVHSDILKFVIEIGFLGLFLKYLFLWIFTYRHKNLSSIKYFISFLIYTTMIYLTDNVSIYVHYICPSLTLAFFEMLKEIYEHRKQYVRQSASGNFQN